LSTAAYSTSTIYSHLRARKILLARRRASDAQWMYGEVAFSCQSPDGIRDLHGLINSGFLKGWKSR
jgi:hypothetical protein